ncbi:hypothetical protein D7Y13_03515 [Corallococcus praedator]|uniref:Uncharacterized protein n=1 Tax=Corallococcus praedator TaxID=2316724 RepID=A0ABX9QQV3_9BACT|nr:MULTISPECIES: hypothetical protein [Corallococcus]RKH34371.1 hypothetical protein D7X75_08535 [Corallococcus sp. CA031C]RKI15874.1 hypothetical protein D7Y13_03515 [Corallococcus praedator]
MLPSSVALLGFILSASPPSPAPTPVSAASVLHAQCRTHAADPKNPWALAHGMDLDGRAFRTRDGRPASEAIVAGFLRRESTDAGTPARYVFDAFAPDGTPVEPHPALQVKTFLLSGYPMSHAFPASWGPVSLRELVASLQQDFRPALATSPDGAWALDALSHVLKPGGSFQNGAGETVRIDAVMDTALGTLESANAALAEGMKAGRAEVPKNKQGIYAHPCGGLHFFQAVAGWARFPSVRKAWGARLDAQVDVLVYRLGSEARQYEAALAAAPAYRIPVLVQMVKFYGHWLEALGRYRNETGWKPTPAQARAVAEARAALESATLRLEATGAFRDTATLALKEPQLALDLVGDACHAARGWDLWPVAPGAK